mmetsp:Transcript_29629/g.55830  ORF Transcript_29629/g.55830 Transcript_29629/m.55830 type:complete len:275 (+) Transcript_29629:2374-3198(+)
MRFLASVADSSAVCVASLSTLRTTTLVRLSSRSSSTSNTGRFPLPLNQKLPNGSRPQLYSERLLYICSGFCRRSMVASETHTRPQGALLSSRAAVFTVSPKYRYRGHTMPGTPAKSLPLCTPHRIFILSFSLHCREVGVSRNCNAVSSIRCAWSGCLKGTPDATMYTLPTVSTLYTVLGALSISTSNRLKMRSRPSTRVEGAMRLAASSMLTSTIMMVPHSNSLPCVVEVPARAILKACGGSMCFKKFFCSLSCSLCSLELSYSRLNWASIRVL